jgi:4-hydroxybenzoyl-CoA thioesterase
MFLNRRDVTIEWGDCDPAGIVFYPRYFAMFDASTAALFAAALGFGKHEMLRRFGIAGFPMVETRAQFHVSSRFGDMVTIESHATGFGRSSFHISHRLMRGDTLAIECQEKRVWAGRHPGDPDKLTGLPLPQDLIDRLSRA